MVKIKIVDTPLLDPMFSEPATKHTHSSLQTTQKDEEPAVDQRIASEVETNDDSDEVDDTAESVGCPFCRKEFCDDHLLASYDDSGEGYYYLGIDGGQLFDVDEIGTIFEKLCLAWVKWKRQKENVPVPSWIENDPVMLDFFKSIKGDNIDLNYCTDDEDAVFYLLDEMDAYFKRTLLEDLCSRCGWGRIDTHEAGPEIPMRSTSYTNLYDPNAKEVAVKVRAELRKLIKQADESP